MLGKRDNRGLLSAPSPPPGGGGAGGGAMSPSPPPPPGGGRGEEGLRADPIFSDWGSVMKALLVTKPRGLGQARRQDPGWPTAAGSRQSPTRRYRRWWRRGRG